MSRAIDLAASIIERVAEKGTIPHLESAIREFRDATLLLEAALQLYGRGSQDGAAEAAGATAAEHESERRQIAVEVATTFREGRDFEDTIVSLVKILKAHDIEPPGGYYVFSEAPDKQFATGGYVSRGGGTHDDSVPFGPSIAAPQIQVMVIKDDDQPPYGPVDHPRD